MGIEKIEEYLKDTGLTKQQLAIQCRISVNWFCLIMREKRKLSPFIAKKICKYAKKIKYEDLVEEMDVTNLKNTK